MDAVEPFAKHTLKLKEALQKINRENFPNLTAATLSTVKGLIKYLGGYVCLVMSSAWFKILKAINLRNLIIQVCTSRF